MNHESTIPCAYDLELVRRIQRAFRLPGVGRASSSSNPDCFRCYWIQKWVHEPDPIKRELIRVNYAIKSQTVLQSNPSDYLSMVSSLLQTQAP